MTRGFKPLPEELQARLPTVEEIEAELGSADRSPLTVRAQVAVRPSK